MHHCLFNAAFLKISNCHAVESHSKTCAGDVQMNNGLIVHQKGHQVFKGIKLLIRLKTKLSQTHKLSSKAERGKYRCLLKVSTALFALSSEFKPSCICDVCNCDVQHNTHHSEESIMAELQISKEVKKKNLENFGSKANKWKN